MGINYAGRINKVQKALAMRGYVYEIKKHQQYSFEFKKYFNQYHLHYVTWDDEEEEFKSKNKKKKRHSDLIMKSNSNIEIYKYLGNKLKDVITNGE